MPVDCPNSLSGRLNSKFVTQSSPKIPTHPKHVTTLPCEIPGTFRLLRPMARFLQLQPCSITSVSICALSFITVASGGGLLMTSCKLSLGLQRHMPTNHTHTTALWPLYNSVPAHQVKGPLRQRSAMTNVLDNRLIFTFRSTGGAIILYSFMVLSLGLGLVLLLVLGLVLHQKTPK